LGSLSIVLLERFGLAIPTDVYYLPSLPVALSMYDVVSVMLAAVLIVWDFAVFRAVRGATLMCALRVRYCCPCAFAPSACGYLHLHMT
jgi:hypothetical protein